jgi:DNA-binding XRE family transcriptional regulator
MTEEKTNHKFVPKNNLRNLRIIQSPKVSQWLLALRSGIVQSRISLIENHLIKPSRQECIKLSSALDKSIDEIFPNNNNAKEEINALKPEKGG